MNGIVLTTAEQVGESFPELIAETYFFIRYPPKNRT